MDGKCPTQVKTGQQRRWFRDWNEAAVAPAAAETDSSMASVLLGWGGRVSQTSKRWATMKRGGYI